MIKLKKYPSIIKTFGSSMLPLLQDGDIVYLKKQSFNSIKVNDIVCCKKNGNVFTHRVIYKSHNTLITKGDNNSLSDRPVNSKQILGVVYQIRRGKRIFPIDSLYYFQSGIYMPEITKITSSFKNNNIRFVILKGLPIHLYYENAYPKRVYADCDILVDKSQLEHVKKLFKKKGYFQHQSHFSKLPLGKTKQELELSFIKLYKGYPVVFDVHLECVFLMTQRTLNSLYPNHLIQKLTKELLNNTQIVHINGNQYPILQKDYLFMYLCLHLFHHSFQGMYRYHMINVISRKHLNYSHISQLMETYKLNNFIYPVVLLLKKYYKPTIPKFFLKNTGKTSSMQQYIITSINPMNSTSSNTKLFMYIFYFSPFPFIRKLGVFFNREILFLAIKNLHKTVKYLVKK